MRAPTHLLSRNSTCTNNTFASASRPRPANGERQFRIRVSPELTGVEWSEIGASFESNSLPMHDRIE